MIEVVPESIQVEIMKFFLETSIPRILNNEHLNVLKNNMGEENDS